MNASKIFIVCRETLMKGGRAEGATAGLRPARLKTLLVFSIYKIVFSIPIIKYI